VVDLIVQEASSGVVIQVVSSEQVVKSHLAATWVVIILNLGGIIFPHYSWKTPSDSIEIVDCAGISCRSLHAAV
jgi:hypothetical protein